MKSKFLVLAALGFILVLAGKNKKIGKLSDSPLNADNILMGVSRGWYTAKLGNSENGYTVQLSGKNTDGSSTTDVYPITEETYNTLVSKGIS